VVLLHLDDIDSQAFEMFTKLRVRYPQLPVIILSPRNEKGAKAAITAITMDAIDVVTKPTSGNNLLFANRHLSKRLIPIVKAAAAYGDESGKSALKSASGPTQQEASSQESERSDDSSQYREPEIITIGGCCGGPKALFSLITKLPRDLSVPVVVVQHFPQIFTKVLAEELDKRSRLSVREVADGAELKPGTVWIASGGCHTEVHRDGCKTTLRVHRGPRELGDRPSINMLFRSAVRIYEDKILGIILSGIGLDGLAGAEAIHKAGGQVLVQEPRTSIAPEMPANIIRAGLADHSYTLEEFVEQILKRVPEHVKSSYSYDKRIPSGSYSINHSEQMKFSTL
jgi:two-component system chemotaxis response regulator CheB